MKLTIETVPFHLGDKTVEIRTYFDDDTNTRIWQIVEIIDQEFCKNKQIMKRMIDRQFYELKTQAYKHFALL